MTGLELRGELRAPKGPKVKIATVEAETPDHLKPYALSNEHFSKLLKGYKKVFDGHVGKGNYGPFEMTTQAAPSPVSPGGQSPLALVQPRQSNRASYVQRWKVLRDRNKNLPQLDFNSKATGVPKKYTAAGFPGGVFSRSYTYDAMKLPSISTASVITGVSNISLNSDGYRRRGRRDKKSTLQEQQSESLQDLSTLDKEYLGLTASLSKSLTNLTDKKDTKGQDNKHKYERFSYSKQISSRRNTKSRSKDLKDLAVGGTFARENTFASSYISQDSHKKHNTEKREQPHKDSHTEKYKELRKIYGIKTDKDKKEKDRIEPREKDRKQPEKVKEKIAPNKSVRIITPPSPSTYRSPTYRSSNS